MPLDTAWFDRLPDAPDASPPAPQAGTQPSAGMPPNARGDIPTMIVRPSASNPKSDSGWFDALPDAPDASQPGPEAARPAWASGPRSVQMPGQPQQPQQMSAPVGADEWGSPIFDNAGENSQVRDGTARMGEKFGEGATLGMLPYGVAAARTLGGVPFQQGLDQARQYTNQTSQDAPVASMIAEGAGSLLPTMATFGAANPAITAAGRAVPYLGRPLAQGAVGAALGGASAAGGDVGSGQTQHLGADVRQGAMMGGALAAGPAALGEGFRPFMTPSQDVAQLAQLGRDTYNIPITGPQMSGNRLIKTTDSALKSIPFSGHAGGDAEVQSAVNAAVGRTFGEDATKLTPDVLGRARARIGGVLQDVESRNPVSFDQQTLNDLADIESNAHSSLTAPEYDVVRRQLNGIIRNLKPGDTVTGTTYGNLMHKGSPLDAAANSANPNIAGFAGDIKHALRGSLERSLSGADAASYRQARTQWKNLKTIEPLTQSADVVGGATPSMGDVNPNLLRGAVNRAYPNAPYAPRGSIPLNDISDIAQRFLKEPPTSHTSERGWLMHLLSSMGGTAIGLEHGGLPSLGVMATGAAGLGASTAATRGLSAVMRSKWLADAMIRNGLNMPAQSGVVGNAAKAAVPEIAKPDAPKLLQSPGPSVNTATGLPEFALRPAQTAQSAYQKQAADKIVAGIKSGALPHDKLRAHLARNKRELRQAFGGQGINNIERVGGMYRNSLNRDGAPSMLSAIEKTADPEFQQALRHHGITDMESLASRAMTLPGLTDVLATKITTATMPKAHRARLLTALQRDGGSHEG
jgi:hypothetical protein